MSTFNEGDRVEWDWGNGTAEGEIVQRYTRKITVKIKGNEVTRDASPEAPAFRIRQDDGDEVLKSGSELRAA
ncbi:DUF2945 domain-containing protein [Pseudoponticoccus marisrubri]|uniref:Hypervirulence associated protein TUDOR domain-containing protein n=1 Tax=Pseudoponticoccus marisrubri TaxID=1685382 RepID=A0A0W7WLX1_9RHOB|nr:DUF2945 domain-containing protein [Pseudoponticoccus marisrubri]KUF11586.1 hypothetical protein AVJ23_07460 [Pseudoponticoccus marisrubri]